MILTVDVGNTNIVLGIFDSEKKPKVVSRIATNKKATEDEYAAKLKSVLKLNEIGEKEISGAIISSVVPPLNNALAKAIEKVYSVSPMIVGPGMKTGINLLVDNPAQVGADIICGCVAAHHLYDGATLVLDMGTATKMMVIDEAGAFIGVSIIPGVEISMHALADSASLLPQISLEAPEKVIAKNTIECMRSGLIFGTASMIDGMIDRIKQETKMEFNIVATGGLMHTIVKHCKHDIIKNENLILEGLYVLYNKNCK